MRHKYIMRFVSWKVPNTCKGSSYKFCSVEPLLVKTVNQDTYQWSWGLQPTSWLSFFFEVHQTFQRGDSNFYLPLALSTEVCDVVPATDKLEARKERGEVHRGKANHPLLICGGKRRAGQCGWARLALTLDATHREADSGDCGVGQGFQWFQNQQRRQIMRTRETACFHYHEFPFCMAGKS